MPVDPFKGHKKFYFEKTSYSWLCGHGKVVADAAEKTNEYEKISSLDDNITESKNNFQENIIGVISETNLKKFAEDFSDAFVAIGDNEIRIKWLKKIEAFDMKIPNIIHPSAQVSKYVDLGYGCFINTNVVIQRTKNKLRMYY